MKNNFFQKKALKINILKIIFVQLSSLQLFLSTPEKVLDNRDLLTYKAVSHAFVWT